MTNETLQPTPDRVLERPTGDRIIGGVAAALARRLDIGVGWIRTAFIVLTFFGGLGIALYAIGWVSIRGEGEATSIAERTLSGLEGGTAWVGGLMMVIAAMVLVGWFDIFSGELVLAAGLFVAGLLIYQGRFPRLNTPAPHQPGPSAPPPGGVEPTDVDAGDPGWPAGDDALARAHAEVEAETQRVDFSSIPTDYGDLGAATVTPAPAPVAAEPRPRSILGTLSAAAILITLGVMAFLDRLDIVQSDLEHYLGAVVLISGIGLVIGAWFGRARGLIILGVLLAPVAVVAGAVGDFPFDRDFGNVFYQPATIAELPANIERGGGELVLDLTDLPPLDAGRSVAVDMGAGEITIIVPDDLNVVVDASVGVGNIESPFGGSAWLGVERTVELPGDGAILHIDADLGVGNIDVDGVPR